MNVPLDVLIVEDRPHLASLLQEQFVAGGLTAARTADAETAQCLLKEGMQPRGHNRAGFAGLQSEECVASLGTAG